jgi:glycosyltransferase involved in cell wall biosynthesis
VVIPLAAGAEFYEERNAERIAAVRAKYGVLPGPYILSLCTLGPRKNLAHLVRVFREWVRREPGMNANLVLAGGKGWEFEEILREVNEAGEVRGRIHCAGRIDDADLAALYGGAAMFVYPSLYEGFGLPALEAMQCGVPVIASNTSSLPEVVGAAGILVAPRDGAALQEAMRALLASPQRQEELRAKGLARAREFSWAKMMEQTVGAYRRALACAVKS